ncbi:hypothetical protein M8J77_011538 [Diaphorina citri]|nr:hypothetical protein M8J77_011538 [Diaphorina citri]
MIAKFLVFVACYSFGNSYLLKNSSLLKNNLVKIHTRYPIVLTERQSTSGDVKLLKNFRPHQSAIVSRNTPKISTYSGISFQGTTLRNTTLKSTTFHGKTLESSKFQDTTVERAKFQDTTPESTTFQGTNVDVGSTTFQSSTSHSHEIVTSPNLTLSRSSSFQNDNDIISTTEDIPKFNTIEEASVKEVSVKNSKAPLEESVLDGNNLAFTTHKVLETTDETSTAETPTDQTETVSDNPFEFAPLDEVNGLESNAIPSATEENSENAIGDREDIKQFWKNVPESKGADDTFQDTASVLNMDVQTEVTNANEADYEGLERDTNLLRIYPKEALVTYPKEALVTYPKEALVSNKDLNTEVADENREDCGRDSNFLGTSPKEENEEIFDSPSLERNETSFYDDMSNEPLDEVNGLESNAIPSATEEKSENAIGDREDIKQFWKNVPESKGADDTFQDTASVLNINVQTEVTNANEADYEGLERDTNLLGIYPKEALVTYPKEALVSNKDLNTEVADENREDCGRDSNFLGTSPKDENEEIFDSPGLEKNETSFYDDMSNEDIQALVNELEKQGLNDTNAVLEAFFKLSQEQGVNFEDLLSSMNYFNAPQDEVLADIDIDNKDETIDQALLDKLSSLLNSEQDVDKLEDIIQNYMTKARTNVETGTTNAEIENILKEPNTDRSFKRNTLSGNGTKPEKLLNIRIDLDESDTVYAGLAGLALLIIVLIVTLCICLYRFGICDMIVRRCFCC